MSTDDIARIDEQGLAAWSNHDVDGFIAMCADDIVWNDVALPEPLHGKEAARQYFEGWMRAFPDMTVRRVNRVLGADSVAVEVEFDGTNTGPMLLPDGTEMPATGAAVKGAKGVYFARIAGGKIAEMRSYPDVAGLMGQLGITGI